MHRHPSHLFLLGAVLFLQACVTESPLRDGLLDCEGLTRVPAPTLGGVCVLASASTEYRGALLDGIEYSFLPVGTASSSTMVGREADARYPIGPQQRQELETLATAAFAGALEALDLVSVADAGSDVLAVRGQILDVLLEAPEDPDSGAKYLLDPIGRATLVVELFDSETDTLLLRAFDHRETKPLTGDDSEPASSRMAAIADLWRAVLTESAGYLP